ncbi:MAG: DUF5916 domain-containing protein [Sediminibacterium sp.]|jgi:hypothetical protein
MRNVILGFLLCIFCVFSLEAQNITEYQKHFELHITPTNAPIKIDGVLDEPVWSAAGLAKDFHKKYPNDIGEAQSKTEVRFTYDDKNIYFGFKVYDSGAAISQSLKRDIGHDGGDGVGIMLDPLNQKTNGFFFVVSALNVQSEDQLNNSFQDKPSWSWDTKWFSATKDYGTYWIAEIAIPLKSLRFDPAQKHWGINFLRIDAKHNEYSPWTRVPTNFKSYDLGYTGVLHFPASPPKNSSNIILQPYITGNANEDKENGQKIQAAGTTGFDAKVAVNSSLNLDLTVNPDFSQVDVDQQVTNLTRFNIFLPEKRTFFLENSDLFSDFGIPPIRPFYSRSIGLDKDGNRIPILFGARLSGNIDPSTRIGVMDMQTGRQGNYSPENFAAFTVHKRVLKRSSIKTYFLNRENFISEADAKKNPLDRYGRNAGMSFEYSNPTGSVGSWATYNQSFKQGLSSEDKYVEAGFNLSSQHWNYIAVAGNVGKNYYTDMGFVQRIENYDAVRDTSIRVGFKNIFTQLGYQVMPTKGKLGRLTTQIEEYIVFNPDNSMNESNAQFSVRAENKNTSGFEASLSNTTLNLLYPISITGGTPLPAVRYSFNQIELMYRTDFRKAFSFNSGITLGQFYNGTVQGATIGFMLRKQPHLNLGVRSEFNSIQLPGEYGSTNLILIQPRIEYNFNTQLFWTTFIQYNTQSNNFSINSRLQYRYKPMSDFFLVYTDNYFTDPMLKNKNRALVFKFNYWFNL